MDIRKEYRKERKRLSNIRSRYKKQGFLISKDWLPKIIKNPTLADLNALKMRTVDDLEQFAFYFLKEDKQRKKLSFTEGKRYLREQKKLKSKLPDASQIIVTNFLNDIAGLSTEASTMFRNFINNLVKQHGYQATAAMLQMGAMNNDLPSYRVLASDLEDELVDGIGQMLDYLPDLTNKERAELISSLE